MPTRKITVVQLVPHLDSGGVERGTVEVADALVRAGHRSIVISGGGRLIDAIERGGSRHYTLPVGRKSLAALALIFRLRRVFVAEAVDLVHARSRLPAWLAWLALRTIAPSRRPVFVTTVHGLYSVKRYSAIMARGDWVIAVSQTARRYVLDHYSVADPDRIEVIYRGVDRGEFHPEARPSAAWLQAWAEAYPQLSGRRLITLPGRLTRLKGHEDFLQLIGRLRADGLDVVGLVVGGEDPRRLAYAAQLRKHVAQSRLKDAVLFTGDRQDLKEIMLQSDVVVSLSRQPESFGRTTLEALSLGIPVVGYDHGGVGEILERLFPAGRTPVGDPAQAAERVATILRERSRPRPLADNPFELEAVLQQEIALYQRYVNAGHPDIDSAVSR